MPLHIACLESPLVCAAGDSANGTALVARARQRGVAVRLAPISAPDPVPSADIYLVGGQGESGLRSLRDWLDCAPFVSAVADGAVVLAVDLAATVLGHGVSGGIAGLGLIDVRAEPISPAEGEVVTSAHRVFGLPALSGWQSRRHAWRLGGGVAGFGSIRFGAGAGTDCAGFLVGQVLGTWLHGPALGRNPELADLVLRLALREDPGSWQALPSGAAERGRALRIGELLGTPPHAPGSP